MNPVKSLLCPVVLLLAFVLPGCRHQPVYPEVGSVYLTSKPSNADILVDGASIQRRTPAKIDNLGAGPHDISLRFYGFKVYRERVEVKGGMTRRMAVAMRGIQPAIVSVLPMRDAGTDMAYEPASRRLFVAMQNQTGLLTFQTHDSTVSDLGAIQIGTPQTAVAVSQAANRIYAVLTWDTIAAIDLAAGTVVRRIIPPARLGIRNIVFSQDGRLAVTADSIARSLTVINTASDAVERTIPLPAAPSDVLIDPTGAYLYVTLDSTRTFEKRSLFDGSLVAALPTRLGPGGIFWDPEGKYVGFCNRIDKTVTLVDVSTFVPATGHPLFYGHQVPEACLATDGTHLWGIEALYGGDPIPPPSFLALVYRPTWGSVANLSINLNPVSLVQSPDGQYLYILERGMVFGPIREGRDIMVVKTDIN